MPAALEYEIARLTGALRRHMAMRGGSWGLVGALGGILIAAMVARLMPLWHQTELLLAGLWGLSGGILLGALLGYVWPMPVPRRLRLFDRRLRLADRLTTAWELAQTRITAPAVFIHLQHEETLNTVRKVAPQAAFPCRPPRSASFVALLLIAGLIPALFFANPQEAALAHREAQQQATEAVIAQLEQTRADLADNPTLSEAEREAALKALDEALATLHDRQSTPAEQQAALAAAEQRLAALRAPEAAAQLERLAEASPVSAAEVVQPLSVALQKGDAEAAATYLRSLLDPTNKEPLTAEEMLTLADAFTQIADALQTTDPALAEQFQKAAQEIYTGDIASAREAIAQAAETLSEVAQANAPNQTLEQAQAGLQQAQQTLGNAQRQTTEPTAAGATTQLGSSETQGTGMQGQPGSGAPQGTGGETGGVAVGGHHEDTGSSAPYGEGQAPRLAGQGGEITIPRQETLGAPHTTTGAPGETRVPYTEVYADYVAAARAAMARNAYPPALRAYVRQYFEELEP